MNTVFTPTAWEQYTEWQREDKKMVKHINELIKDSNRQTICPSDRLHLNNFEYPSILLDVNRSVAGECHF